MSKEEEPKETNNEDKTEGLKLRGQENGQEGSQQIGRPDSLAEIRGESFGQA